MAIYTVHLPPEAITPDRVAEKAVFVKEGFAIFGFAFTGLWLLTKQLERIRFLHALDQVVPGSRTDEPPESWAIDGFLQKSIERPSLTSDSVLLRADENQHSRAVELAPLSNLGRQGQAVLDWHLQVDQHHIEAGAFEQTMGFVGRLHRTA